MAGRAQASVDLTWGVQIPMRDGIHLNATLYMPKHRIGPAPVIFTLTPYIGQFYHDRGLFFARHGYPFLTVDCRGRGNSQGVFKPHINESQDGHDVVEWLAQQLYCNGQVAMWGSSYGGYDQWATARSSPPHLATIVPVAAPFLGVDVPMRNNIFANDVMVWLAIVSGRAFQDKVAFDREFWVERYRERYESGRAFRELDLMLGNPSSHLQEWLAHPERGPYWDAYNPTADEYARMQIPILTVTGAYDGDQLGTLEHHRRFMRYASSAVRARHYLIVGPWNHGGTDTPHTQIYGVTVGPASLIDLPKLYLEWYDWTMQNGPKPDFLKKNVAYYVMGADKWRYADTLEAITARLQPLYLHSASNPSDVFKSGDLVAKSHGAGGPDHYVYDPRDVSLAELESTLDAESRIDQRMIHAAPGKQLIYHSEPFTEDTEVSGFFRLSLWLSIDQPDTDFRASIYEVDVDGSSILLTRDSMRARYRQSLSEPKLIRTSEPLRYDFEQFTFVSRLIKKRNRLRLVIGPINSMYAQKNYNSGKAVADETMKDARPVTVKLFHDEAHPTALYVPLAHSDT